MHKKNKQKNFSLLFCITMLSINSLFFISCQNGIKEETNIEIKSLPTKLNYYINETLDLSGLEINKKTAGISTLISKDEYEVIPAEGTTLTDLGANIVKITAYNQSIFIVINVNSKPVLKVENIILNTSSITRNYGLGDTLDLSALKVTAQYSDETIKEITNYTSIPENGTILNTLGMQTVTIIAEGKSASFDIQVLPDSNITAQVVYEVYSDIPNLISYDSLTKTFTALPNYDSYRWFVDDKKQTETSNTFVYEDCINHTITVIVNAAGANYSAQLRIE